MVELVILKNIYLAVCSQLGLIGIANRHLLAFEEYFLNQEEDLLAIFSLVYPFIPLVDGTGSGVLDLKTNDKVIRILQF